MTPLIKSVVRTVIEIGFDPAELQWFDLSSIDGLDSSYFEIKMLETHRPPFEKNMVVWAGKTKNHAYYEFMMTVVGSDPSEGIVINLGKGALGDWFSHPSMVYLVEDGQIRYGCLEEKETIPKDVANLILALVSKWYESMDSGCRAYIPEIKNTFTNKRKIQQGKKPLYEWRTVVIEPSQAKRPHQGGTHASPRLHDRRGHIRRLKSGKNVWVRPCKVGDVNLGTVFHDYKIEMAA
jgi:hypothetical protein